MCISVSNGTRGRFKYIRLRRWRSFKRTLKVSLWIFFHNTLPRPLDISPRHQSPPALQHPTFESYISLCQSRWTLWVSRSPRREPLGRSRAQNRERPRRARVRATAATARRAACEAAYLSRIIRVSLRRRKTFCVLFSPEERSQRERERERERTRDSRDMRRESFQRLVLPVSNRREVANRQSTSFPVRRRGHHGECL